MTVDILPVTKDWKYIGLIKRAHYPEMGKLVLAGGHVDPDNRECKLLPPENRTPPDPSVLHAVKRETKEEINISLQLEDLQEWEWLDEVGRDPRENDEGEDRRISKAFLAFITEKQKAKARAKSDALELHWIELDSITPEMIGFDHFRAIKKLQVEKQRRRKFWKKENHSCLGQKRNQENPNPIKIFWVNDHAEMIWGYPIPDPRDGTVSGGEAKIVACPFCGHPITPPIKD